MMTMTWEEKLAALQALGDTSLRMRKPGDWYVSPSSRDVWERGSGVLVSVYGNGSTPQEAVEDDWRKMTELDANCVVVINARGSNRRQVIWNGYMWRDVP